MQFTACVNLLGDELTEALILGSRIRPQVPLSPLPRTSGVLITEPQRCIAPSFLWTSKLTQALAQGSLPLEN